MKLLKTTYFIMLSALLSSCDFHCSVGENKTDIKTKPVTSNDNTPLNGAVIKNDIELEATGVKLRSAYLVDARENLLKENITGLNEKIYLVLKTDTGWVKENNLSFLGAAERISTNEGNVLVDAADIFKDYETAGLPADKADVVSLSAIITKADPGIDHFVVQFRVWDKKGGGEIKGKYMFKIR
jgi:hypothetical protein